MSEGTDQSGAHRYADSPLVDLGKDVLDRGRLVGRVVGALERLAIQQESSVVALVGPWGSGKTTLLNAVEKQVRTRRTWSVAHYNPWLYSSIDAAAQGFFAELRGAVPEGTMKEGARATIGRLGARVAPLGALTSILGVDTSGALKAITDLVVGDQSPERLRAEAAGQLAKIDRPVLVILDDLDRLEPTELLLTFRLIRLVGRLPNVFYLLAYDEATLEDTLSRTDLVGSAEGRARDYLEKMIQLRFDVPPLLGSQRVQLVNEFLDAVLTAREIELGVGESERLQEAWTVCLSRYMVQPRAIRRLVSQVDVMWPEVAGEVDFVDFLVVNFLRVFERDVFDLVVESRDELVGLSGILGRDREDNHARWKRWLALVETARARFPESVLALLTVLFLTLKGAKENMAYGSHHTADIVRRRGIGCDEFFDRYTQFGVPPGDLSDLVLKRAIGQLDSGDRGEESRIVEVALKSRPSQVVSRLLELSETIKLPKKEILRLLSGTYASAVEANVEFFAPRPHLLMLKLGVKMVNTGDCAEWLEVLPMLCDSASGTEFVADLIEFATRNGEESPEWFDDAVAEILPLLEARLKEATTRPLFALPEAVVRLFWNYSRLAPEGTASSFFWSALDGPGPWELEDFIAVMVPTGRSSDGRRSWVSLGELETGSIESLLGVDAVLERFGESDLPQLLRRDYERRGMEVTPENRRLVGLSAVRRAREDREAGSETTSAEDFGE